jgi:DNA polymerase (family 10)
LRRLALAGGLKLNEYGLLSGRRRFGGRTETEMYGALGLPLIPPEQREAQGEIEAAQAGTLPPLITLADLRGDLHVHTDASDGRASLATIARVSACISDTSTMEASSMTGRSQSKR